MTKNTHQLKTTLIKPRVIIIAGSPSDEAHYQKIAEAVRAFGIETLIRITSAHKTPGYALDLLKIYESENTANVYITVAGRSNALSGFVDGAVLSPVIACPPPSEALGGVDIFSSLRMPSGIAPAVVLDPQNAALLAVKILALYQTDLREQIAAHQHKAQTYLIDADCNAS
jgi:5-(carboxyamino)imidazole ribonucleotide mutase